MLEVFNNIRERTTRKHSHPPDSLKVLPALIAKRNMKMIQFDVRTAFLYGELDETIYMEIPEGLEQREYNQSMIC